MVQVAESHTPLDEELQEEEQDLVKTDEEAKFEMIDNLINADLYEKLNGFQMMA